MIFFFFFFFKKIHRRPSVSWQWVTYFCICCRVSLFYIVVLCIKQPQGGSAHYLIIIVVSTHCEVLGFLFMGVCSLSRSTLMPAQRRFARENYVTSCVRSLSRLANTPDQKSHPNNKDTQWLNYIKVTSLIFLAATRSSWSAKIKRRPLRYSCSFECIPPSLMWRQQGVISDILNAALQIAPGKTFLDRPRQREQQRCVAMVHLNPLIPLLMHSYKYSTGKNLSCCRPSSAPGVCKAGMGIYY